MHSHESHCLRWQKSSRSGTSGGNCVEVAMQADTCYVRDSKNPGGGVLRVDAVQWTAFLDVVRNGPHIGK
ncbi:DUF397 domain-containing protein [Actinocatenispora comari]|uniref:DUF397 domain-containing protein n=1 Tax=Actinocatenispora comari TaxID=2807577 RepID=A0A8J4AG76_9ACTN|nr:DUF397 domain-containing protein [Actinocatenispora comari]GIL30064.1 hypothetical protein NUM_53180 [Actinocatenispora comari]